MNALIELLAQKAVTRPAPIPVDVVRDGWDGLLIAAQIVSAIFAIIAAGYAAYAANLAKESGKAAEDAAKETARAAGAAERAAESAESSTAATEALWRLMRAEAAAKIEKVRTLMSEWFAKMVQSHASGTSWFVSKRSTEVGDYIAYARGPKNFTPPDTIRRVADYDGPIRSLRVLETALPEERAALRLLAREHQVTILPD